MEVSDDLRHGLDAGDVKPPPSLATARIPSRTCPVRPLVRVYFCWCVNPFSHRIRWKPLPPIPRRHGMHNIEVVIP